MNKKMSKSGTGEPEKEQDQELPDLNYPAGEDIMNPKNGFRKVEADVEGLANSKRLSTLAAKEAVNNEDIAGPEDELDIPGAELDDDNEKIGEEDEENNYYSLGGDRHEDLEEDRS